MNNQRQYYLAKMYEEEDRLNRLDDVIARVQGRQALSRDFTQHTRLLRDLREEQEKTLQRVRFFRRVCGYPTDDLGAPNLEYHLERADYYHEI